LHADEESLRIAAIDKLPDGDALRKIAGLSATAEGAVASPATLERAARARMAQLIDEGSIDFADFCDQARNHPAMFAVAALCKDAGRLTQALVSIGDPAQLAQLVVEGPSSRLRQLAAERVHDPQQLRQLLARVRNKDKNVY
jgi:uroporphyrinogen-III decarboxylase